MILRLSSFIFVASILFLGVVAEESEPEEEICSTVDDLIEEFQDIIAEEKEIVHILPYNYPQDATGINSIVEASGDIQRIFEHIDDALNISSRSDDEQSSMTQKISQCSSFKDLVTQCEAIIKEPTCDENYPYRSYNGTCNNLDNPSWGALFAPYRRILPTHYVGTSTYRKSVTGDLLPTPRNLSVRILTSGEHPDDKLSHMFMFFGQFLTHEMTEHPNPKVNNHYPMCCPPNEAPWCDPIRPDPSDPFYSQFGSPCTSLLRNPPFPTCKLGKRTFMNGVPSFLDGHMTYGRTDYEASVLRTHDDTGRLKVHKEASGDLLMPNVTQDDLVCVEPFIESCFMGGDSRTNQHATLTSIITLFTLEHNRMAEELKKLNKHWDGERIYQVARKINGALIQNIVYKEYLPHLFGDELVDKYGLRVGSDIKNHYDKNLKPNVVQEFATFGFRLHGTINSRVGKSGCANIKMKDTNPNPDLLHEGCMASFLSQTCRVPQQTFGPHMSEEVQNFFGRMRGHVYGSDLGAADIQRGRDHGVPPYKDVLAYILGEPVEDFQDLLKVMSQENIDKLKQSYQDFRDVDPWIGTIMEDIVPGTILGRTALNLTIDHFKRYKTADRFYFENEGLPSSFTKAQIRELRKVGLTSLICSNTNVKRMPPDPFLLPSSGNKRRPCSRYSGVNLKNWKEKRN